MLSDFPHLNQNLLFLRLCLCRAANSAFTHSCASSEGNQYVIRCSVCCTAQSQADQELARAASEQSGQGWPSGCTPTEGRKLGTRTNCRSCLSQLQLHTNMSSNEFRQCRCLSGFSSPEFTDEPEAASSPASSLQSLPNSDAPHPNHLSKALIGLCHHHCGHSHWQLEA